MKVKFAHIRERATSGGWIDFAVFDAKSTTGSEADNEELLYQLTASAIASGLKVDQSALAYMENGRVKFYGTPNLVEYLSHSGVPQWTHHVDV